MKALVLVDIQNDFLPDGNLPVPEGDKIIQVVNQLQYQFELVVATQDWHPVNHKSFASNHDNKSPFETIDLNGLEQILWPDHCVQGTRGADFSINLDMSKVEAIFRKGTDPEIDSYSGFYDNGHRKTTAMAAYLRGKEVRHVYLCGLAGDICVFYTAIDSLNEGFETFIIEDAYMPLNKTKYEKVLTEFKSRGGVVLSSSEIH